MVGAARALPRGVGGAGVGLDTPLRGYSTTRAGAPLRGYSTTHAGAPLRSVSRSAERGGGRDDEQQRECADLIADGGRDGLVIETRHCSAS